MTADKNKVKQSRLEDTEYEVPGVYFKLVLDNGEQIRVKELARMQVANGGQLNDSAPDATQPKS